MMSVADRIRKLVDILRAEDLDEIEVRTWFTGIRVARRRGALSPPGAELVPGEPEARVDSVEESSIPGPADAAAVAEEEGLEEILSPMVGTFYRSAGPDNDPFISEGSHVETGQVLCIIEAMKLMNEIEAEADGIVARVLVDNSHPVEYGEPLFLLEPV